MLMYYFQGQISATTFEAFCTEKGFEPKKTVFLFPGNPTHHTPETTLFSKKVGSGLASVAAAIGEKGYPTLSLPTTGVENFTDTTIQEMVNNAIADIYRALEAGFTMVLPVRKPLIIQQPYGDNIKFFNSALSGPNELNTVNYDEQNKRFTSIDLPVEPSFWGLANKSPNPPLAAFYLDALNQISSNYSEGRHMRKNKIDKRRKELPDIFWFDPSTGRAGLALAMSPDAGKKDKLASTEPSTAASSSTFVTTRKPNNRKISEELRDGLKKNSSASGSGERDVDENALDTTSASNSSDLRLPTSVDSKTQDGVSGAVDFKNQSEDNNRAPRPVEPQSGVSRETPKQKLVPAVLLPSFEKKFNKAWGKPASDLEGGRVLCKDYTDLLFFDPRRITRHNINALKDIIANIDNGKYENLQEVHKELSELNLSNPKGHVANLIAFLGNKIDKEEEVAADTYSAP